VLNAELRLTALPTVSALQALMAAVRLAGRAVPLALQRSTAQGRKDMVFQGMLFFTVLSRGRIRKCTAGSGDHRLLARAPEHSIIQGKSDC
jgi:hypothetical protein